MARKMLVGDYRKCTGCRSCELACSLVQERSCTPSLARLRVVRVERQGINIPTTCAQCARPVCMAVCPVGAIKQNAANGAYVIDKKRCIGCKACAMSCPFGMAGFDFEKGIAYKCQLCGDPVCARFCPTGALRYTTLEQSATAKRRYYSTTLKALEGGRADVRLDR